MPLNAQQITMQTIVVPGIGDYSRAWEVVESLRKMGFQTEGPTPEEGRYWRVNGIRSYTEQVAL